MQNLPKQPAQYEQGPPRRVIGVPDSAAAYFLAKLHEEYKHLFIVTPNRKSSETLYQDLCLFIGESEVALLPSWDTLPLEPVSPSIEISAERIRIIDALQKKQRYTVIASAETLLQRVIPPADIQTLSFTLETNQVWDRSDLVNKFLDAGFMPAKTVYNLGEFSLKGAVIDVFPSTTNTPLRLEFDGNTISEIRSFDKESQRSSEALQSAFVLPVKELSLQIKDRYQETVTANAIRERATNTGTHPREVDKVLSAIEQGEHYPGLELMQYIASSDLPSIIDTLSQNATLCILDTPQCQRCIEEFYAIAEERADRLGHEQHLTPTVQSAYIGDNTLIKQLSARMNYEMSAVTSSVRAKDTINMRAENTTDLATKMRTKVGSGSAFFPLKGFIDQWRNKGFSIAIAVGSHTRAQRLQANLLDIDIEAPIITGSGLGWIQSTNRDGVVIIIGHLTTGFRIPADKLCFIAENDLYGERSYRSGKAPRISAKRLLNTLALLKEGDHLVHIDYGVGVYKGLQHLTVDGILGDFLHIDYADSTLYLPAHQIGKVQKFVGAEGQAPNIDRLSSTRWARTKQKVRDSIVTLAGDLVRLYASRSVSKGWRFEPLGAEDERFADTFPFDETPDQRKAIEETLVDLSSDKPMDRLVCGDVGFGKTEVAIRAAFKCTQHARQVAVLVPTTILVEQHAKNFQERFADYPVTVGTLSRFHTAQQNRETLERVASGEIDIVVGTHRLLQPDVQFKDLGLLIIDEEHRFGVKQKERLRSYRTNVDVLTLTATPIPRTLHMSLLDIRDISLIQSPPVDRRVVHTYVAERDDALIRDAILREIRRDGQAFFIHNRVQSIGTITEHLRHLIPEARFEFAHGQMSETHLEKIMRRYIDKEIDVLVATTIVESGLDVPNANTIIIDRADHFGLAQLYQLRGRVGRGKRQAYAYLIVPHLKSLTGDAHERLKVLQSIDTLGAGFNLAIRDLEIRGAGNLLGKEQSGSVLSVGFDMYCRILQEAVADLKGDEPILEDTIDPEIKIAGVDAFIPETYVPDIGERLVLYQRLSNIRSDEEAYDLHNEIEDRFGPSSEEVDNLMLVMRYRSLLRRFGVVKATITPLKASLSFTPIALLRDGHTPTSNTRIDGLLALKLVQNAPKQFSFGRSNTLSIVFSATKELTLPEIYRLTEQTLEKIRYVVQ